MSSTGQGTFEKGTVARMVDRLSKQDFGALTRSAENNVPLRINRVSSVSGAGSVVGSAPVNVREHSTMDHGGGTDDHHQQQQKPKEFAVVRFSYAAQQPDELDLKEGDELAVLELVEDGWARGCILQSGTVPESKGRTGLYPTNFVATVAQPTLTNQTTPVIAHSGLSTSIPHSIGLEERLHQESGSGIPLSASCPKATTPTPVELATNGVGQRLHNNDRITGTGTGSRRMVGSTVITPSPPSSITTMPEHSAPSSNTQQLHSPSIPKIKEFAKVLYKYEATNPDELSLAEGAIVAVVSRQCEEDGWFIAEHEGRRGLFPDNFVRFLEHEHSQMSSSSNTQPPSLPAKPAKLGASNASAAVTPTGVEAVAPVVSTRDSLNTVKLPANAKTAEAQPTVTTENPTVPVSKVSSLLSNNNNATSNSLNRRSVIEGLQKQLFPGGKLPPQRPPQPSNLIRNRSSPTGSTDAMSQIEPKLLISEAPAPTKLLVASSALVKSRTNIAPTNKRPPSKVNSAAVLVSTSFTSLDAEAPRSSAAATAVSVGPSTSVRPETATTTTSSTTTNDIGTSAASVTSILSKPTTITMAPSSHGSHSPTAPLVGAGINQQHDQSVVDHPPSDDSSKWVSRAEFERFKQEQERKFAALQAELEELRRAGKM